MKNAFIPYELAVLAKQKGFNEPCIAEYYKRRLTFYKNLDESFKSELDAECDVLMTYTNSGLNHFFDKENTCTAPLYQQILDWFRTNHKIYIYLDRNICKYAPLWIEDTTLGARAKRLTEENYDDYDQALHNAIEQAFKLI